MRRSLLITEKFASQAPALRTHFEERFADPRTADAGRFVWDFWHVPGQYTALRTPAWLYFPKRVYDAFHQRLVWWGRRVLGCHDVSPPWLSLYVEGCRQELHGDLPHGQWAFVFSLTPDARRFRGGETLLVRDEVLDYWRGFESTRGVEEGELVEAVAPRFNRLVVFDPRIPHGVRRVEGVLEPRDGRLVVHGWFVQPRPFIEGPLRRDVLQRRIDNELLEALRPFLERGLPVAGMLSLNLKVAPEGRVTSVGVLSDTTRVPAEMEAEREALLKGLLSACRRLRFGKQRGASRITLPFVFER